MNWKSAVAITCGALWVATFSNSPSAYAAPPPAPCSLLTTAQVSGVLGVSVDAGKPLDQSGCEWAIPGKTLGAKGVLLYIVGPVGNQTPVDRFNTIKTPLPVKGITKTPVSGIGDDAVYGTIAKRPELTVKKGNFVFQVKVNGFPEDDAKAKEKTLALDVLAKL